MNENADVKNHDAIAWLREAEAHDREGRERSAVALYEHAIDLGLPPAELRGALLGLGSTYRALGRYDDALRMLNRGAQEFPHDLGFAPFLAMTLYNLGRPKEAVTLLLRTLAETTSSEEIQTYRRAIQLYAEDLDRTW